MTNRRGNKRLIKVDNPMLIDLLTGNVFFLAIGLLVVWIFLDIKAVLGFLLGGIISIMLVIHMAYCIDDSIRMNEGEAARYNRKGQILRTVILIVIVLVVCFTKIVNPLSMICGAFILKLSAYIQPITNRLTSKIFRKGR